MINVLRIIIGPEKQRLPVRTALLLSLNQVLKNCYPFNTSTDGPAAIISNHVYRLGHEAQLLQ
jgi:hypothetical protein